ncbi:MAG: hypothetical protein KatS3mg087_1633 [Patescibacteria group bacterium]|nr:MAG: hypothetical protein KatS3mg087_1633 [Patescibacteria group bacterium]
MVVLQRVVVVFRVWVVGQYRRRVYRFKSGVEVVEQLINQKEGVMHNFYETQDYRQKISQRHKQRYYRIDQMLRRLAYLEVLNKTKDENKVDGQEVLNEYLRIKGYIHGKNGS